MDKTQANKLSRDLNKAVNALLKEHGINAKTYLRWCEDGEIRFTAEGKTKSFATKNVIHFAKCYGFTYTEGQLFRTNGKMMELVDFNRRAQKYPWIAFCPTDGKKYRLSTETVERALTAHKA